VSVVIFFIKNSNRITFITLSDNCDPKVEMSIVVRENFEAFVNVFGKPLNCDCDLCPI
jgi:hypothetical protein